MKEIRLCSHCGSYELVSFDYDPDRGGVPRLFGYVNDNVIDMDYDEEEERFGFWLDGVYCRKCNTLDDTYYWKVPDNFTGTETGHILSERDSKLVMINKYMVRALSGLNDKEKYEFIKEIKESIYDIIKKYNVEDIFDDPQHPYTRDLMKSIPKVSGTEGQLASIQGSVPDATDIPPGCSFHTRCQHKVGDICEKEVPEVTKIDKDRKLRCFLYNREEVKASARNS